MHGQSLVTVRAEKRWVPYVAPFALFLLVLAGLSRLAPNAWSGPLWFAIFIPVCVACWPRDISLQPSHWLASIGVGIAAFVIWIAPDLLVPGYRGSILFSNNVLGHAQHAVANAAPHGHWAAVFRAARATLIVPVVEEFFWRGWLMRWLIDSDFERISLGAYRPVAFWVTGILFASEHGPYWDVGLLVGVVYNLWMIRTKSLADCILMHAVTNGVLSAYVIVTGQWEYWQ